MYTFSNGDQNNSKAGHQQDKRKENKKSSKSEMRTTNCEDDLIDDQGNYSSSFLTRHRDYYHYHEHILYHLFVIKLINYPEGMQQLLVESEGGTVLFQSTNVTILPPGATSINGYRN